MGQSERGKGGSSRAGPGREGSWAAGFARPGEEGESWAHMGKGLGWGLGRLGWVASGFGLILVWVWVRVRFSIFLSLF